MPTLLSVLFGLNVSEGAVEAASVLAASLWLWDLASEPLLAFFDGRVGVVGVFDVEAMRQSAKWRSERSPI